MSRILLDTSGYSQYMRGHPDLQDPVRRAAEVHLNAVVVGELLASFKKGSRTRQNEERLRRFVVTTRVRVLTVDAETAERYAAIKDYLRREGTPIPANDLWIAATAFQHSLRVLTLDEHYLRVPQIIVDFFEPIPPVK
jgi:predicted nucleic acid-binding protein